MLLWFLLQVGKQTVGHSKDEVLKKDLPLTLDMVESASKMLVESATGLKVDNHSKKHLELLLNGARGGVCVCVCVCLCVCVCVVCVCALM